MSLVWLEKKERVKKGGVLTPDGENLATWSHLTTFFTSPPLTHTYSHTYKRSDPIRPLWQRKAKRLGRLEDCSVINTYTVRFRPFSSFHMGCLGTSSLSPVTQPCLHGPSKHRDGFELFYLVKFLWRNNGSWLKSFSKRSQEICPK